MRSLYTRFLHVENHLHHQFVQHSITALRIAIGAVFLGFGVLKYFPGVSPAQNLTEATTHILFLGLVPGDVAIVMIATLECFIGLCLLTRRWMRLAIWLLAVELIGILSPVILLPGRLFAGPHHAPTLEGQYVLKDLILVAAGLVIAAGAFRGGRLVRGDLPPASRRREAALALDRAPLVLEPRGPEPILLHEAARYEAPIGARCERRDALRTALPGRREGASERRAGTRAGEEAWLRTSPRRNPVRARAEPLPSR